MEMKFSKEDFSCLGLSDLLLNIHSYAQVGSKTHVTLQYAEWCAELAAERWLPEYVDYQFVMSSPERKQKLSEFLQNTLLR